MHTIALYTTIYPGIERFLPVWCASINRQEYRDFDIWIGVDGLETKTVTSLLDSGFTVRCVSATAIETPASLRCRVLDMITENYEAIILVDSDDILEQTRVAAALQGLQHADLYGCALGLIDVTGRDLGIYFGLNENDAPDEVIPYNNFMGFSNTAWKSHLLKKYLPVPSQCVAMDWLLATRAWGDGARIAFDKTIRMRYRQYGMNTACVMPPFSTEQIINATAIVRDHYQFVIDDSHITEANRQVLRHAAARIDKFNDVVISSQKALDRYVTELNKLPAHRLWWLSVAHPELEEQWNC